MVMNCQKHKKSWIAEGEEGEGEEGEGEEGEKRLIDLLRRR